MPTKFGAMGPMITHTHLNNNNRWPSKPQPPCEEWGYGNEVPDDQVTCPLCLALLASKKSKQIDCFMVKNDKKGMTAYQRADARIKAKYGY